MTKVVLTSLRLSLTILTVLIFASGCGEKVDDATFEKAQAEKLARKNSNATIFDGEKHFANLTQLTFGGQNAEAYFSSDGSRLIFQSTRNALSCDAIFIMNADGSELSMVSSGKGTTSCGYIAPNDSFIIYASTHLNDTNCPPKPDMSRGYVWSLFPSFDIFKADPDGSNLVRLTESEGYDAEGVMSVQGDKILFTSIRTGDLELFMMNIDGSNVEQLTNEAGYDGGGFFSYDGKSIVWRASRPQGQDLKDYQALLKDNLIRPGKLEIYMMSLKDRKPIRLTNNGAANFGPYFHPSGQKVIFASNVGDPKGRNFDLYLVDVTSKEVERVTYNETFDAFPMFSHDGKRLAFASNRDNKIQGETNIFIADWID